MTSSYLPVKVDSPDWIPLPVRRVDKSVVTPRTVTRYFIYGRGYNSNLVAHMQIAKRYVWNLCWEANRASRIKCDLEFDNRWYAARYPAREGCNCQFCSMRKYAEIPKGRGCWISKLADYRTIAREIIDGVRDGKGNPKEVAS